MGESQDIQYVKKKSKIFFFIPVKTYYVYEGGHTGNRATLNDAHNQFFAVQSLPADVAKDMDYELSDYFYHLHGRGGDDVFHVGPQKSRIIGGDGRDTYLIPANGGHTTLDLTNADGESDLCMFELPYDRISVHATAGSNAHLTYLDTHSVELENWFRGPDHRGINFMAEPGIIFSISTSEHSVSKVAQAATFASRNRSIEFDASEAQYATIHAIQGGNSIGFLDRQTNRLKMGDSLKMSDFGFGMS